MECQRKESGALLCGCLLSAASDPPHSPHPTLQIYTDTNSMVKGSGFLNQPYSWKETHRFDKEIVRWWWDTIIFRLKTHICVVWYLLLSITPLRRLFILATVLAFDDFSWFYTCLVFVKSQLIPGSPHNTTGSLWDGSKDIHRALSSFVTRT